MMNPKRYEMIYDLLDEACIILYEELNLDYLHALLRVVKDITYQIDDTKLSKEAVEKLEEIYEKFCNEESYKEEVRFAFELMLVKAFKHIDRSIDLMTPDALGYLLAYIVRYLTCEEDTIIDTALGTGNLLQTITNNTYPNIHMIGIENDEMLVEISVASSNLQDNDLKVYYQDALLPILDVGKVVIGDLDGYFYQGDLKTPLLQEGITYFPYLLIDERLNNIENGGYFIYIVNCDFFSKPGVNKFKEYLEKQATLVGLILLPDELFVNKPNAKKCIIIGKKEVLDSFQMVVLNITSFKKEVIEDVYEKITKMIEQIV